MPSVPTYPCAGCGKAAKVDTLKQAWLSTPLGLTVVYAHKGCEWASIDAVKAACGRPIPGKADRKIKVVNRPGERDGT